MATILFVDDDPVEQLYAREILESRGHEVFPAGDGEEALEVYARDGMRIDLVVTDLRMPRLNGLRLVNALREMDPRVTILAASGHNADQLDLAERSGVADVIVKPWDPAHFLKKVAAVLEARSHALQTLPDWAARSREH